MSEFVWFCIGVWVGPFFWETSTTIAKILIDAYKAKKD